MKLLTDFLQTTAVSVDSQLYKCASVDTATKTWSGYKTVLSVAGFAYISTLTQGLTYTDNLTPVVDSVYSRKCIYQAVAFTDVLQQKTLAVAATNVQHTVQTKTLGMQSQTAVYNTDNKILTLTTQ